MTVAGLLPVAGTAVPASAGLALPALTLLAPDDSRSDHEPVLKDPVLKWQPIPAADKYQVQISPSEDFSDPENIVVDEKVVSPEYTPSTLLPHASYFWRVRAFKGASAASRWSTAWTFTRGWEEQPLLQPVAESGRDTLRLNWSAVPYASFYEVQISESPAFPDPFPIQTKTPPPVYTCYTNHNSFTPYTSLVKEQSVSDCSFKLTTGTQYYWRVRPHDGSEDAVKPVSTTPKDSGVSHDPPGAPLTDVLVITSVSPTFGKAGDKVTVNGKGFTGVTRVKFGAIAATDFTVSGEGTVIEAAVPAQGDKFGGTVHVQAINADEDLASQLTDADKFRYGTAPAQYSSPSPTVASEAGVWSETGMFDFTLPRPNVNLDYKEMTPPEQRAMTRTSSGDDAGDCSNGECAMTPTLTWDEVPRTFMYRVYVGLDRGLKNIQRVYETRLRSLTPIDSLFDNQGGRSYYWAVQACTVEGCGQVSEPEAMPHFRQRLRPIATTAPGDGEGVNSPWIRFEWQPYLDTAGIGAEEARGYRIQVWDNADMDGTPIDTAIVDHPWFISADQRYRDGTYYWRVQAIDQSGHALAWSAPNRDTGDMQRFVKDTVAPVARLAASGLVAPGPVTIAFAEKVRNVNATSVGLQVAPSGARIPGAVALSSNGTTASFTPTSPLEPGRSYRVWVSAVTDLAGNPAIASTTNVRLNGVVDSASKLMYKIGGWSEPWYTVNASDAIGRSYVVVSHGLRKSPKPYVITRGYGTTVRLYACKSPLGGKAEIALDGKSLATVDLYQRYSSCGRLVWSKTTKVASHTLAVHATRHRNAASRGTRIAVDAVTFS